MLTNDSGNESEERMESLFFDHLDKNGLLAEHNHSDSDAESDIYSKVNEFDVVFHDPTKLQQQQQVPLAELLVDEGAPPPPQPISTKPRDVRRVLTSDNSTDSCTSSIVTTSASGSAPEDETAATGPNKKLTQINTCKILQRKLELKVERAKRNYRQMYEEQDHSQDPAPKSAPLIPISRLPIPGGLLPRDVQQPLVDVAAPGTNSDDDDLEQVSFFPRPMKKSASSRQELSDTFSIQEMTIESDQEDETAEYERCRKLSNSKGYKKILNRGLSADGGDYLDNDTVDFEDDDDDSQNLELLPPKSGYNLKELAQRAFCCFRRQDFLS